MREKENSSLKFLLNNVITVVSENQLRSDDKYVSYKVQKKKLWNKDLFVSHRGIQPPVLESAVSKEKHKKIEEIWTFFSPLFWCWQYFSFLKSVICLWICIAE